MSDLAEIRQLYERVVRIYDGMENMKMNVRRTQNLFAHKLKEDCDKYGVPTPVISDYYKATKHLIEERIFNPLPVELPEDDFLPPYVKMKVLEWCGQKERLINDDVSVYAFAVYMSILVRAFIERIGEQDSEPKKGMPVLIAEYEEPSTEEKLEFLATWHSVFREANAKSHNMIFYDAIEFIKNYESMEEKDLIELVESHSFSRLLSMGKPFRSNAFDFIETTSYVNVEDRFRFEHMHVLAKSGHGKTQLLENFIFNDIMRANDETVGLAVIDGQGDLINDIKNLKALSPIQDRVIIVNPSDVDHPFCLNPFDIANSLKGDLSPAQKQEIYTNAIYLLEFVFSSLGANLTAKQKVLFGNVVELLVSIEGATLMDMKNLLEDSSPYVPYFENLDPLTKDFFLNQFDSPTYADTKYQVLTRLYGILKTPALARMFTTKNNQLDLFEEMNKGAIVLIDTDKSLLKKDGHSLLGRYFLALIVQSAFKRKFIPAEERTPFFVYMDECHDYMDENISEMLDQARKFKVGMVLSHQHYDQLDTKLRASIKTNTSINLYGALSAKDRTAGARELDIKEDKLIGLKSIDRKGADYVIKIGNQKPIKVFTPFGIMGNAGKIEPEVLDHIVRKNREKYCTDTATANISQPTPQNAVEITTQGKSDSQNAEKPAPKEEASFNLDDIEDL